MRGVNSPKERADLHQITAPPLPYQIPLESVLKSVTPNNAIT